MKPKVALVKGNDRAQNVADSLKLIDDDIDLTNKKNILIKLNFSSHDNKLGATHVDAVRPLLKFIQERYSGKITIGETIMGPGPAAYKKYGYTGLDKEFGVELVDLNKGDWELIELYDSAMHPMKLHFSKQVIDSDYRIAIGPAKTHDVVGVTLSIKNLAMGGLSNSHGDKGKMHQGYPAHNLNLYLLAKAYPPHLSIIDGTVAMEGDGPVSGEPLEWGVTIAGCEPVAADCLAAQLMGFDLSDVGYLWLCQKKGLGVSDISEMNILGANPKDCYHKFRPHATFEAQRRWHSEAVDRLLNI